MARKNYLGDGVYVEYDGFGLVLTTEDGVSVTNRIVLEPEVWHSLEEYVKLLQDSSEAERHEDRMEQSPTRKGLI